MQSCLLVPLAELPLELVWLRRQPCPVIAYGEGAESVNADVIVSDLASAQALEKRVQASPLAAMTLVQVLRSTELLPLEQGLDMESLAYSTLQAGPEFAAWMARREPQVPPPERTGEAILLSREGSVVEAVLNRPQLRNSVTVEMRDAWVEALELLEADDSIGEMVFRGQGACFSVGGELSEFGTLSDPCTAHWVRSVRSPARKMARLSPRVSCHVHGACIGSGIELPAFAARLVAHSNSYFQLPELALGLIPGAGGTVSIARRIGRQKTAWMVLSGRRINARTALAWGLVDAVAEWPC